MSKAETANLKKPTQLRGRQSLHTTQLIPRLISVLKITLSLFLALILSTPLYALNEDQLDYFDQNGIYYYNPDGGNFCPSSLTVGGEISSWATAAFDSANIKNAAQANLSRYESAATQTGLPWQAIAALHYREAGLNPQKSILNGQEIGSVAYTNVDGQTIYPDANADALAAANHLKAQARDVYDVELSSSSTIEDWAKAFLAYNRGYMYKAASPEATYDQSPYVMNGIDDNHLEMRWIHADSWYGSEKKNSLEGSIDARPGALAIMIYLGASDLGIGCTSILSEGGMTEAQAKQFMIRYGENIGNDSYTAMMSGPGSPSTGCIGGALSNCVSFSAFFMNKFSSSPYQGGNGYQVVNRLAAAGTAIGNTPSVYAVFSIGTGLTNHTGVILGIQGDQLIVGHAACGRLGRGAGDGTLSGGGVGFIKVGKINDAGTWHVRSSSALSSLKFAYLNNLDTQKIQEYINYGP